MRLALWIPLLLLSLAFGKNNFFAQGNQLYDQGKYLEAVKYYRGAIQNGEFEPYAWFNLGNSLVHLEKHNLAMVAYRRAIELAPKFVRPWVLLGDLYYLHDNPALAIVAYKRAQELGENTEHLHYALGESYRKLREFTLAEKELEWVVRQNPDRVDCWFALASVREELKDPEGALQFLHKAIDQAPSAGSEVYFYMAYLEKQMDSLPQAIRNLEDGLLLAPSNLTARRQLADLYIQQGSPWLALFTLEQGLSVVKAEDQILLNLDLAYQYSNLQRDDESFTSYLRAWKLGSSQGRIGAESLARYWEGQGKLDKATGAWKRIRQKQ